MNCEDIRFLLDERDTSRLTGQQQQSVQAHLGACPECARDWQLQLRLAAMREPSMPVSLAERCRKLVVADAARGRSRIGSHTLLAGAVLVAAAAAAMVGGDWLGEEPPRAAAISSSPTPQPSVRKTLSTEQLVEAGPEMNAAVAEPIPALAAQAATAGQAAPFTVVVLPLVHETDVATSVESAEVFHRAFVLELQRVAGLKVVENGQPAQYHITLKSLPPAGPLAGTSSPLNPIVIKSGSRQWQMQIIVDMPHRDPARYITESAGHLRGDCAPNPDAELKVPVNMTCPEPQDIAWGAVQTVRRRVFSSLPPPPGMSSEFDAQAVAMLDRHEQMQASMELTRKGRDNWNSGDIRALIGLARAEEEPLVRLRGLFRLRGAKDPTVALHLAAVLRDEPDASVRLGVMQLLQHDHADSAVAKAGIAAIAQNDPDEMLRQVARRIVSAEPGWRQSVNATLVDESLTNVQRMELLLFIASSRDMAPVLPQLLQQPRSMEALARMLPEFSQDPSHAEATARLKQMFTSLDVSPAATAFIMEQINNALRNVDAATPATLESIHGMLVRIPQLRASLEAAAAERPEIRRLLDKLPPATSP